MMSCSKIVLSFVWAVWFTLASWGLGLTEDGKETEKLGEVLIEHRPVKEHIGEGGALISVRIEGETSIRSTELLLFYRVGSRPFQSISLEAVEDNLQAMIPHQPRGTRVSYYLEARDPAGRRVTLPAQAGADQLYRLKFKGHARLSLLLAHIGAMFVGALLFLLGAIFPVIYLRKEVRFERISKSVAWGTLLIFIGGFPLGMAMGYAVFGEPWTGLPIGGDVTDTKTLIVFIYWLVIVFLLKGTIFQRGRDWVSREAFARLTILGTALTALIYLIPHSI